MSYLVPAAAELIQEVTALTKGVKAKAIDRPDENGRHRTIEFDPATARWLFPTLDMIDDERIANLNPDNGTVTFVGDHRAERRTHFQLMRAIDVLRGHS